METVANREAGLGDRQQQRLAVGSLLVLAGIKLGIHLALSGRYGYFRDELYYLAGARHLDWGYVDHAPLIAIYSKLALLLGGSLPALRMLPAIAGAAVVGLTVLIAMELGGGRFAQALAGVAVLAAPIMLATDSILTMNAFEPVFWMGCVYVLLRVINTGNSRLWPWFGMIAGLGLENKHSMLFFGLAITMAILLSEQRREFLKPWLWIAGGVAVLIFLPNLIWEIRHSFPTLEDLENVRRSGKNVRLGPVRFLAQQVLILHPLSAPLWVGGVIWFFRQARYRVLGWTYVVFLALMMIFHAKDYYLAPIYPMLFAGGAVGLERWLDRRRPKQKHGAGMWPEVALIAVLILAAIPIAPLVLPVLSPGAYVAYTKRLGFEPPKTEVAHSGPLPQMFGDQFGWPELVSQVAAVYWSLPPEQRARTAIYANNYGEAGAIDLFGPHYGLPGAISPHQTYFYWGPHGFKGDILIVLQDTREGLEKVCRSVDEPAVHYHPYGMAEENRPIHVCRGLRVSLDSLWPQLKHWN